MRIRPSITFLGKPEEIGRAGNGYAPNMNEQPPIKLDAEGFQRVPPGKGQSFDAEVKRLEEYDKGVKPSVIQISIPGAGSGLSMAEKLAAKALVAIAGTLVKLGKKKQVEAENAQRQANERESKQNEEALNRSSREHFERLENDRKFRNNEGRAIDRGESRDRAGDDTRVA